MICPHCQRQVPEGPECAACGIVVAKYLSRQQSLAQQREAPPVPLQPGPRRGPAPGGEAARPQAVVAVPASFRPEKAWLLRPVSDRRMAGVYGQMAWMLESGIPLTEALRHVSRHARGRLGRTFESVRGAVESGATLVQAMQGFPEVFPDHLRALVDAGEQTGALPDVFRNLARSLELRLNLRMRIVQACIYPFILFTLIFFLLPLSRLVLQGWGVYLRESLLPYLTALAILFLLLVVLPWGARRVLGPAIVQRLGRLLPLVGGIQELRARLHFSRQLSTALGAGMDLHASLELAARSAGSARMVDRLPVVRQALQGGGTLQEALERTGEFDEEFMVAVSAGEASGRLEEVLDQHARLIEMSFLHKLEVAVKLLSVLILLAVYIYGMLRVYAEYQNIWGGAQQQLDGILKELGGSSGGLDDLLKGAGKPGGYNQLPPELKKLMP